MSAIDTPRASSTWIPYRGPSCARASADACSCSRASTSDACTSGLRPSADHVGNRPRIVSPVSGRRWEGFTCRTPSTSSRCPPRGWSRRRCAARSPGCAPTRRATSRTSTTTSSPSSRRARRQTTVEWVHGILEGRARPRHLVPPARGDRSSWSTGTRWAYVFYESGLSINVLYGLEDGGEACGRVQALGRHGRPRGARGALQVRAAEVQARRHDPRLVLRDQGRALTAVQDDGRPASTRGHRLRADERARPR